MAYSAGINIYANKNGVFYYDEPNGSIVVRSERQVTDPTVPLDGLIGVTTGKNSTVSGLTWIEVDWVNSYVIHGFLGFNRGTYNETKRSWVKAIDTKEKTTQQVADEQAAKKAEDKAKKDQAIIDGINTPVKNPNLTANGGGGASQSSWVWYLVGGVLVFVAGLVVWKLGQSKKRQANPLPSTQPQLAGIQKPKRLKK